MTTSALAAPTAPHQPTANPDATGIGAPATVERVDWIDPDNATAVSTCDAAGARSTPFETALPVRTPPAYRGQRNLIGYAWSAKAQRSLLFESRLEMSHLLRLDRDPAVRSMATQPFRIVFRRGKVASWAVPDIFCRLTDGSGRVVECKRAEALANPKVAARIEGAKAACEALGFRYEVATELPPVYAANLRWLAGFRRDLYDPEGVADRVLARLGVGPATLADLFALGEPSLSRPAVFGHLWSGRAHTDLSLCLSAASVATAGELRG